MVVTWRDVGSVRVAALVDGVEDLDELVVETFPDVPSDAVLEYRDRMPAIYGAGDRWRLIVRAWLVLHSEGAALVDTGIGPVCEWFPRPGRLQEALIEAGSATDAIDTVVITHVHDDHIGGTVTDEDAPSPAFPNARYVVQRADADWHRRAAEQSDEDRASWGRLLQPLIDAGVLDEIDGDDRLAREIDLQQAPGHTPGHQIVRILSNGRKLTTTSDAFTHPGQLAHPEWTSTSDHDAGAVAATRRRLVAEFLADPESIVAPTHLDPAFGRVVPGFERAHGLGARRLISTRPAAS
jgi:glyoxylase-like metal-dependent hydrolase (beta-lactamase superfamily II)